MQKEKIVVVVGPTASGKSSRAIALAKESNGEVISMDSRQVYRTLDIGTEKITEEEMGSIPHHLIDIREPEDSYSAGDFVHDATQLITDIISRNKTPILAGGTHFYLEALLYGLPVAGVDYELRTVLELKSTEELYDELLARDPRRAERIDAKNPRRLIRALEIVHNQGTVPERSQQESVYDVEWIIIDPPKEELRARIDARLVQTLERGLIEEVRQTRERVGDARLNELGLEYRIVGEFLRGERSEASLLPALSSKLWHYARHQKAWLRKLQSKIDQ